MGICIYANTVYIMVNGHDVHNKKGTTMNIITLLRNLFSTNDGNAVTDHTTTYTKPDTREYIPHISVNRCVKTQIHHYPSKRKCTNRPRGCIVTFTEDKSEQWFPNYKKASIYLSEKYQSDIRWYDVRNAVRRNETISKRNDLFTVTKR